MLHFVSSQVTVGIAIKHQLLNGFAFLCILLQASGAWAEYQNDSTDHLVLNTFKNSLNDIREAKSQQLSANKTTHSPLSQKKIDRFILQVMDQKALATASVIQDIKLKDNPFVRTQNSNKVQVHIYLEKINPSLLHELKQKGLEIEIVNDSLNQIQGWILINKLEGLAQLSGIQRITAPHYSHSKRGSETTQGDIILKANQLRSMELTGKGIRVGIISDGANNWTNSQAQGDLPVSGITLYGSCTKREANPSECISNWTCNEGTAMAEIIYDIAPDAKIAVAASSTSLEFINQVDQLVNTFQADIIVDDLGFFGEPFFEDGDVAKAVAAVSNRVLYISAAGNSGVGHYEKDFQATPGSNTHDFGRANGEEEDSTLDVMIPAKRGIALVMQWNDPYQSPSNDYDLYLHDLQGNILANSNAFQSGAGSSIPIEGFCYYNSSDSEVLASVTVERYSGINKRIEIFGLRGAQQYNHASGSIIGHPGIQSVLAVGTINANEGSHTTIASYSSHGPTRIDFPAINMRKKPDLIGIDGVNVTGTGGFPSPFYGTSAAAPHVAGVAAQLMSFSPSIGPDIIRKALKEGAVDLGNAGFDDTYGYGLVNASNSLEFLQFGISIPSILLPLLD